MLALVIFLIAIILTYFLKSHYQYWEKRGVPGLKPTILVGNIGETLFLKKSLFETYANIYNRFKTFPFVGIFKATTPVLVICDPELIKDITVKSFHNFRDNDNNVDKKIDRIFGQNPFFLKGEEWKVIRSQLTPGFTSGKMRAIYPLLEETSKGLVRFIENETYEANKLAMRFTLNNVASCAFGIDAKAFTDEPTDLKKIAKQVFQYGVFDNFLFLVVFLAPFLRNILTIKCIKKDVEDSFINLVKQTLRYRDENQISREDYLSIWKKLEQTCKEFTTLDLAAHAFGFFVDGYETTSVVMGFVLFQLAANSEVQKKLRRELNENFEENGSYQILQNLPYLDAILNETLRMHPPFFVLGKICTQPYTYTPKMGGTITQPVLIEKGTSIALPLSGLHYDPEFFENPASFNPERFMGANREKIVKYSFMPFGEGPRACLGQKFGVLQIKIGVAYIVRNFCLSVNERTKLPLQYDSGGFMTTPLTTPKGGLWIDFEKIK